MVKMVGKIWKMENGKIVLSRIDLLKMMSKLSMLLHYGISTAPPVQYP